MLSINYVTNNEHYKRKRKKKEKEKEKKEKLLNK
jgi:hypothetical protein